MIVATEDESLVMPSVRRYSCAEYHVSISIRGRPGIVPLQLTIRPPKTPTIIMYSQALRLVGHFVRSMMTILAAARKTTHAK